MSDLENQATRVRAARNRITNRDSLRLQRNISQQRGVVHRDFGRILQNMNYTFLKVVTSSAILIYLFIIFIQLNDVIREYDTSNFCKSKTKYNKKYVLSRLYMCLIAQPILIIFLIILDRIHESFVTKYLIIFNIGYWIVFILSIYAYNHLSEDKRKCKKVWTKMKLAGSIYLVNAGTIFVSLATFLGEDFQVFQRDLISYEDQIVFGRGVQTLLEPSADEVTTDHEAQ